MPMIMNHAREVPRAYESLSQTKKDEVILESYPDICNVEDLQNNEKRDYLENQKSLKTSVIDRNDPVNDQGLFSLKNTTSPQESANYRRKTPSLHHWNRGGQAADKITEDTNLYHYQGEYMERTKYG